MQGQFQNAVLNIPHCREERKMLIHVQGTRQKYTVEVSPDDTCVQIEAKLKVIDPEIMYHLKENTLSKDID